MDWTTLKKQKAPFIPEASEKIYEIVDQLKGLSKTAFPWEQIQYFAYNKYLFVLGSSDKKFHQLIGQLTANFDDFEDVPLAAKKGKSGRKDPKFLGYTFKKKKDEDAAAVDVSKILGEGNLKNIYIPIYAYVLCKLSYFVLFLTIHQLRNQI